MSAALPRLSKSESVLVRGLYGGSDRAENAAPGQNEAKSGDSWRVGVRGGAAAPRATPTVTPVGPKSVSGVPNLGDRPQKARPSNSMG